MLRDFSPGWQLQIARMYCTFQKVRRKDWGTPHHQCKYLQRIYLLILVLYNVYVVQMNSAYWWDSTENSFPKVKMNRSSFLRKTDDIESLIISDLVQAEHWRMTEQPQVQSEGLVHENTEWTCSEMDPWQPELLVLGEFCFASSGSREFTCVWLNKQVWVCMWCPWAARWCSPSGLSCVPATCHHTRATLDSEFRTISPFPTLEYGEYERLTLENTALSW